MSDGKIVIDTQLNTKELESVFQEYQVLQTKVLAY